MTPLRTDTEELLGLVMDANSDFRRGKAAVIEAAIRGGHHLLTAKEQLPHRDFLPFLERATLERLPTFSDCAIQHPIGVENFDPRYMQVSAAIRYALSEDWLLVKGESTKAILPSIQFPQLAMQLVYGHLQGYFAGPAHCAGCKMAKDAADSVDKLGSADVWRQIGTIHHITTVAQDGLGSLP